MSRSPGDSGGTTAIHRLSSASKPTDTVLAYDGWYMQSGNGDRMGINARHARYRTVNFLFADGHVDGVDIFRMWTELQRTRHSEMVKMQYPRWKWKGEVTP